ncbi:MAG: hypothetical protein HYS98_07995 [Deltaproteobacteria bacterium]|nr:hypothetical protein [Deltaproteobacteria bacterium]
MGNVLKGNFKVKKPVQIKSKNEQKSFEETFKERVLASLGGSMVYIERNKLKWDGEESE